MHNLARADARNYDVDSLKSLSTHPNKRLHTRHPAGISPGTGFHAEKLDRSLRVLQAPDGAGRLWSWALSRPRQERSLEGGHSRRPDSCQP